LRAEEGCTSDAATVIRFADEGRTQLYLHIEGRGIGLLKAGKG